MILHIVTDEKFTDYAIRQFSSPEMESEFVLIPSNFSKGECDVQLINKCKVIWPGSSEFLNLLSMLSEYSAIVLHGMHWGGWETPLLKATPDTIKVAWVFWGGDLYGRSEFKTLFEAPISKFLNRIHQNNKTIDLSWQIPKALFQRIDYILTDELEEYEFAKEFLEINAKYLTYNYYTLEETLGECYHQRIYGNNILLGNSASMENNLFDVLLLLRLFKHKRRKIIVPLSYGAPWVRINVQRLGKILFGKSFCPLIDFVHRDEYNTIMLSCNTMVMNHWAPQAQGNMITGLWLGMRLYMSERSMTYSYFKRIGLKIYTIEHDLTWRNKDVFAKMNEDDVKTNRNILKKYYGNGQMMINVREIVQELKSYKI